MDDGTDRPAVLLEVSLVKMLGSVCSDRFGDQISFALRISEVSLQFGLLFSRYFSRSDLFTLLNGPGTFIPLLEG